MWPFSPCRGVYIAFTVAECVALVKALRVVILKHVSKPTWDKVIIITIFNHNLMIFNHNFLWDKFLVVTIFETLHVVGLCILFFGVFPEMGEL